MLWVREHYLCQKRLVQIKQEPACKREMEMQKARDLLQDTYLHFP